MGRLREGMVAVALATAVSYYIGPQGHAARLTSVSVAMGYIANVQFTPFYVAQYRGYYRDAGLDVHFDYGNEPNLLRLVSNGNIDFVNSGGDELLVAVSQGLRLRYVMTQYTRFPSAIFALRSRGIRRAQDLRGHSVGIPGKYGASYVGLLAFLRHVGVPASQVKIESIGFTQIPSVANGKIDAGVGYANNEPIQLRHLGYKIIEFDIFHAANLAGAGLATGTGLIQKRPKIVRALVRATLQGMRYTLRHPNNAFLYAERAVPEIKVKPEIQRAVLRRSLDFWRPATGRPLGWVNPHVWSNTARLLYEFGQIRRPVQATKSYTNAFLP